MLLRAIEMWHALRRSTLALLASVVCLVMACSDSEQHGASVGRGVNVQLAWRTARGIDGHQVHVVKQHVQCTQCHDLTATAIGTVSPSRCATCHQKESAIHHGEKEAVERFGAGMKADCTLCHAFTDGRNAHSKLTAAERAGPSLEGSPNRPSHAGFKATDCISCHAVQQGSTPAVVVHGSSDCVSCHRPHEDATPKPGPCASCHHDITTSHASLGKSAEQVCTTCHQHQHAPASDALGTCVTCHATQQPIVPASALFAGGHTACVGCHRPHDFGKQAAESCRTCHAGVTVLAAAIAPAHNQCTNCHSPHDVRGSPALACAGCHVGVHADHPKQSLAGACVGCHDAHPASAEAHELARPCSSCHQTAHEDKDFHLGVACTLCHKPHGFELASVGHGLCSSCHAGEVARAEEHSGHQNCAGCHRGLPHHPASLLATCETCHASEQHDANRGHQVCTKCHEPHSGTFAAGCAGCHEAEAHSAPAGHAQCLNCHQPHSGSTQKVSCVGCHAPEAQSKHGQITGGCANCHVPHGPKGVLAPPACTTCHEPPKLLGLHQIAKHQTCSKCHTGHGDQPSLARDACLSCHADKKTHFPDAPRCASCHLFDTPR